MTERQLQDAVLELARLLGYMAYHTHDSRRSAPGFPDLVLARGNRLVFAELKTEKGKLSLAQQEWILALERSAEIRVWRPCDWLGGGIEIDLRSYARRP